MIAGRVGAYDDCGHGTHVCGIIGGDGRMSGGKLCGIAPGCRFIVLKVLDRRGHGTVDAVVRESDGFYDLKIFIRYVL